MYLLLWSREEKKIECWSTVPKINKPILHGRFLARSNGLGSRLHDRSQLAGLIPSPLYFPLESPGDIVRRCQHCHWLILQSGREREKKLPEKTKKKEKMRKRISRVPDSFHHINSCHFPGWENGLDEWQEFCRSCIPRFIFTNSLSKYNYTIVATLTWFTKTLKLTILITILCIKISFLGQKRSLMLHKKNQSMRHLCDKSVNSCLHQRSHLFAGLHFLIPVKPAIDFLFIRILKLHVQILIDKTLQTLNNFFYHLNIHLAINSFKICWGNRTYDTGVD